MEPEQVITDLYVLAAVDRVERHREWSGAPIWGIYDHLGVRKRSSDARRVRAHVAALTETGSLEPLRRNGVQMWRLTSKGRARLRRAKVAPELPESPQHQTWHQATTLAAQEIERVRENLRATLTEAGQQLDADASSDAWFELSERLAHASWVLGSATYCLREWEEPTDDRADIDDRSDPSDAGLSRERKGRRRYRRTGRRNIHLWRDKD